MLNWNSKMFTCYFIYCFFDLEPCFVSQRWRLSPVCLSGCQPSSAFPSLPSRTSSSTSCPSSAHRDSGSDVDSLLNVEPGYDSVFRKVCGIRPARGGFSRAGKKKKKRLIFTKNRCFLSGRKNTCGEIKHKAFTSGYVCNKNQYIKKKQKKRKNRVSAGF